MQKGSIYCQKDCIWIYCKFTLIYASFSNLTLTPALSWNISQFLICVFTFAHTLLHIMNWLNKYIVTSSPTQHLCPSAADDYFQLSISFLGIQLNSSFHCCAVTVTQLPVMKQMAETHILFLFISESYFMSLVKIPIKPWAYQEYMHFRT